MWHAWKTTFNCVVDIHAPRCTERVKASKSPWITSHLKDEMHKRNIQKIKAIRSNDSQDWSSFKKMRNSVNHKIFRAKETYFKNAFCENKDNPKKTWNIINELTSKNRKIITKIDLNGHLINDSNKIADAFNEYVSNIGPKLADNIDFNEGNRSYLDYLSGQHTNLTFQLKETNSLTVSVLL